MTLHVCARADEESASTVSSDHAGVTCLVRNKPYPAIDERPEGGGGEGGAELLDAAVIIADINHELF